MISYQKINQNPESQNPVAPNSHNWALNHQLLTCILFQLWFILDKSASQMYIEVLLPNSTNASPIEFKLS